MNSHSHVVDIERKDIQRTSRSISDPNLRHRPTEQVVSRPFAGRLGGNQAFTLSEDDPNYDEKLRSTPDAGSGLTWKESLDLNGFRDVELWKQAMLECWASSMLTWVTGLLGFTFAPTIADFSSGPVFPSLLGAITNAISLMLFIFAAGPISGGHMNPLITIATFFGRLATLPRTILYIIFQTIGSTVGAFFVRAALGNTRSIIPGCYIDSSLVTAGEAFALEIVSCMTLVFLAFGIGLDPRQKLVYGPALAPMLIGLALGLCTFATGAVKPGYAGAAMNPARCFGLMAAEGRWNLHWVHWAGALSAGLVNGLFYWAIPPSKPRKL